MTMSKSSFEMSKGAVGSRILVEARGVEVFQIPENLAGVLKGQDVLQTVGKDLWHEVIL